MSLRSRSTYFILSILFVMAGVFLAVSCSKKNESGLAMTVKDLVKAYNEQKAESYREHFSAALKEKFSLDDLIEVMNSNMEKYGPIENFELNISPDGSRGLVFLQMEKGKFDVHIRVNDSSKIERLTWLLHKIDPSENPLTPYITAEYRKLYQPIADELLKGIRDTNVELVMSLFSEEGLTTWAEDDIRNFLGQINTRGVITKVGELEILAPSQVLLPIYFESDALGFYLNFDDSNKIADVACSNYAVSESAGKSLADLGEDTLRTTDLLNFSQLEEAFKRDSGKVRLIALLSPT